MPRQDVIETRGVVLREEGNGFFRVVLDKPKDHTCLCRLSGKLIKRKISILVGDVVDIEISPYDLTKGRITFRHQKK